MFSRRKRPVPFQTKGLVAPRTGVGGVLKVIGETVVGPTDEDSGKGASFLPSSRTEVATQYQEGGSLQPLIDEDIEFTTPEAEVIERSTPLPPQPTPERLFNSWAQDMAAADVSEPQGQGSEFTLPNLSRRTPQFAIQAPPSATSKIRASTTPATKRLPGIAEPTGPRAPSGRRTTLPPFYVKSSLDDVERLPAIHPSVWASRGERKVEYRGFVTAPPVSATPPTTAPRRGSALQLNTIPLKRPSALQKKEESPAPCWRCALHLEHSKCETTKYIRIGGGYRHSYWFVRQMIERARQEELRQLTVVCGEQRKIFQEKLMWRVGADGKRERRIKTFIRTSSGRKIAQYQYVPEDVFEDMMQLRDGGSESAKRRLQERLAAAGISEDQLDTNWDPNDIGLEDIALDDEGNLLLDEFGEPIDMGDPEKVQKAMERRRKQRRGRRGSEDEESHADSGLAFDEKEERERRRRDGEPSESGSEDELGGTRRIKKKGQTGWESDDEEEEGHGRGRRGRKKGGYDDDWDSEGSVVGGRRKKGGKGHDDGDSAYSGDSRAKRRGKKKGGKHHGDDYDDESDYGRRGRRKGKKGHGGDASDDDSEYDKSGKKKKGRKGKKKGAGGDDDSGSESDTGGRRKGKKKGKKGKGGYDDSGSDDDDGDYPGGRGKKGKKKKGGKGGGGDDFSDEDSEDGRGGKKKKKHRRGRRDGSGSEFSGDEDGEGGGKKGKHRKHRSKRRDSRSGSRTSSDGDRKRRGGGRRRRGRRGDSGSGSRSDSRSRSGSKSRRRKGKGHRHRRDDDGSRSGSRSYSRSRSGSRSRRRGKHRSKKRDGSDYGSAGSSNESGDSRGGHRRRKGGKKGHRHRRKGKHGSSGSDGEYSGSEEGEGGHRKHKKHRSRRNKRRDGSAHSDDSSRTPSGSEDDDRDERRGKKGRRKGKHRSRRRHSSDNDDYSDYSDGERKSRRRRHRRRHSSDSRSESEGSDRSRRRSRRRGRHRKRRDDDSGGSSGEESDRSRRRRRRRNRRNRSGSDGSDHSSSDRSKRRRRRRKRRDGSEDSGDESDRSRRHRKNRRNRRHDDSDDSGSESDRSRRRRHRRHRRRSHSGSSSSRSRRRGRKKDRHRRRRRGSGSDSTSYSDDSSDDSRSKRKKNRRHRKHSSDDSDSEGDGRRRKKDKKDRRHRRRYSTSTEESSAGDEKPSKRDKRRKDRRKKHYSDSSETDSDASHQSRGHKKKKQRRPPRPPSSSSSDVSTAASSAALRGMTKAKRRQYERQRREKLERKEKRQQMKEEYERYQEKKERKKERRDRRERGEPVSDSSSEWGDGKTAVKYGKGSRRKHDKKDEDDFRDIGYDDPNDPWKKKDSRRREGKKKDRSRRTGGDAGSSDDVPSSESDFDGTDPTGKKKKKDKKKMKGKGAGDISSDESEESIYEDVFNEDGTIERKKIRVPKQRKKKEKVYDDDELDQESEYDSIGSADADKLIARQIYDKDGEVIRLTRSGRRIKDGKISKEVFDLDKHKQKKEKKKKEKQLVERSYEEEYVEEFIDDEGQVVRVVKKRLKGQAAPGRRPATPLTGPRRVQVLFLKGGKHLQDRLQALLDGCTLGANDPRKRIRPNSASTDEGAVDLDERDGIIDYVSHYRLVDPERLESYGKAFVVEDTDENNVLSLDETKVALEGIPSLQGLGARQMHYILKILGIDDATMVTFKMFAVVSALCERLLEVIDEQTKQWMEVDDLMDIERKLDLYRQMFYWNICSERSPNYIKASSLRVELIAGGVSRTQEDEVMARIETNVYREVSFIDYMAFVPLFLCAHENIVKNPLDDSRDKFKSDKEHVFVPEKDMVPLGRPMKRSAALNMQSIPIPYIFEKRPGSSIRKRLKLCLPKPPVEEAGTPDSLATPVMSPVPPTIGRLVSLKMKMRKLRQAIR